MSESTQQYDNDCLVLQDLSGRDRPAKRKALQALDLALKSTLEHEIIFDKLLSTLLHCTASAIDGIREQAVNLIIRSVQKTIDLDSNMGMSIITKASERLKPGVEPTEETRAEWLVIVQKVVTKTSKLGVKDVEVLLDVAQIGIEDAFPEAQKQAGKLLVSLAREAPVLVGYAGEKPLHMATTLLVHRHSALRVLGLEAVEAILLRNARYVDVLFVQDQSTGRAPIVPTLMYDHAPQVRLALVQAVGRLFAAWPPSDRYNHAHQLLPVILTSSVDGFPQVVQAAQDMIALLGKQCAQDLVDSGLLDTLGEDAQVMGLMHVVHMAWEKTLKSLLHDIQHFIATRQITALSVLNLLVGFAAPKDVTRSLNRILHQLIVTYCTAPDSLTVEVASVLATKVPLPDIYLDILLPHLQKGHWTAETGAYPTATVLTAVLALLDALLNTPEQNISIPAKDRIKSALSKDHITSILPTGLNKFVN
ncbi:armadillo-type protein [Phycomyces blakesleeanus]|uniref:Armadillo-type protein n=1 Tax=Phycomyces blakesleeanus TaxID=4837 RepID=A0ABR3B8A6_PHYBL